MKNSGILIGTATLALGALLLASPVASAPVATAAVSAPQGQMQQMSPADRAKMMTDRLDKAVTLTDDQKPKVEAIYEKAYTDAATARQNGDMQGARDAMSKATSDVKALLTPEQLKKFPQGRGRRGGGGGGGHHSL